MTLLCLAAMWLAGFGLVRWLFPRPIGWSLHNVFLFSLAVGTGAGVFSSIYFVALLHAGQSFVVLAAAAAAVLVIALALGFLTRRQGTQFEMAAGAPVPRYLTVLLLAAAALALVTLVSAVLYNPHGDEAAWSIWNLRARFLFRSGADWRLAFSHDLAWSQLDYPLLLPGLIVLCWDLVRQESTAAPVAIAFLFALATPGVLMCTLAVLRGRMQAVLGGVVLLGTASFIALSASLYGDVPLSFYILATLALISLQDRFPHDLRFSALAGLMAGFAAWTRNEGLVFVGAMLLARVFALAWTRNRSARDLPAVVPQLLRFVAGLAAPLAVVIVFKLRVAPPPAAFSVPASTILAHLADIGRWITMLEGLVLALFQLGRYLIPIVLLLGLYWYLVRSRPARPTQSGSDRAGLLTAVVALLLTLAFQLVFDVLYDSNLAFEIGTSGERILLQLWPAALLAFFLAAESPQLVALAPGRKAKTTAKTSRTKAARPGRSVAETR
jgi:hypothetical protein